MQQVLRTGMGAVLVLLIMVVGSLVLWLGTPLLWLWIGSQIESVTSVGAAIVATFVGAVLTIVLVAAVLAKLSNFYRANCIARGQNDPGHVVLEMVLAVSAGITVVVFAVWFLFLAGAQPLPFGVI